MSPSIGDSIYWRFKGDGKEYRYGWVAEYLSGGLIRVGDYNGDSQGRIVAGSEIEWKRI